MEKVVDWRHMANSTPKICCHENRYKDGIEKENSVLQFCGILNNLQRNCLKKKRSYNASLLLSYFQPRLFNNIYVLESEYI